MDFTTKIGPIQISYDTEDGLDHPQLTIVVLVSVFVYSVCLSVVGFSPSGVAMSLVSSVIVTLGLKRYYLYQNAKSNQEEVSESL